MQAYVTHMLQCPACHGHLTWAIQLREGERIIAAEAQRLGEIAYAALPWHTSPPPAGA